MITCTRRLQFCAGHRVLGHENKCATPHGHNYIAYFEAHAPSLDNIGRVIDFSVLKEKIGSWIDKNWDHTFVVYEKDQKLGQALMGLGGRPIFFMPSNPTAENMAGYLLYSVCPEVLEGTEVRVVRVTIYETENCHATAELERIKE